MVRVFLDRGERLEAVEKLRVGAEYTGDAPGNLSISGKLNHCIKYICKHY